MDNIVPPDLEKRFLKPQGWRWHEFEREGRSIRFGSVFPQNSIPDAVIVCLQGVREFSEKYFEISHWCLEHNLAFWTFDWAGQGLSTRFLDNPQKRHSQGFDSDIEDLHHFIMAYIKHSSVHPDKGRIPMALLAHSMGANLGLRFLKKYPDIFECAAFTAPMIGLKAFEKIPQALATFLTSVFAFSVPQSYIPGGKDWSHEKRADKKLSSDPVRGLVHTQWCSANPPLQSGDVTFGWLHEAQKSCRKIQDRAFQQNIETPCLFGIPGHEHLVDNALARSVIANIKSAKSIEFSDAYHEILMEKDEIRNKFLEGFYELVKETIIDCPETLKPF